jgi:hypothetical protein
VRAGPFFDHASSACRAKRLDRKVFAFLHLCLVPLGAVLLDYRDRFTAVDDIWVDRVAVEVGDCLDCG